MKDEIEALYHYTSIGGFKGIIDSSCLHATNIKYLNDSKEYIFGLDYFSNLFLDAELYRQYTVLNKNSLYDHLVDLLFSEVLSVFKYLREASNYFVISFSREPDVLSQWRAYGEGNVGYCIKFNYHDLFYPSDLGLGLVVKVDYVDPGDLGFARKKLEDIKAEWKSEFFKKMPWLREGNVKEYNKMLRRYFELEDLAGNTRSCSIGDKEIVYPDKVDEVDGNPQWYQEINKFVFFVVEPALSEIAYSWKHYSFSEESEYRYVFYRDLKSQVALCRKDNTFQEIPGKMDMKSFPALALRDLKFKEGKTFLVPYVEIPYDFKNKNIIDEVIVGPCPHPIEAASSVQQFLDMKLDNVVKVVDSKVPYRYW